MSENKINLVVPKDYNGKPIEVVLREGEAPVALDPKEQESRLTPSFLPSQSYSFLSFSSSCSSNS